MGKRGFVDVNIGSDALLTNCWSSITLLDTIRMTPVNYARMDSAVILKFRLVWCVFQSEKLRGRRELRCAIETHDSERTKISRIFNHKLLNIFSLKRERWIFQCMPRGNYVGITRGNYSTENLSIISFNYFFKFLFKAQLKRFYTICGNLQCFVTQFFPLRVWIAPN